MAEYPQGFALYYYIRPPFSLILAVFLYLKNSFYTPDTRLSQPTSTFDLSNTE